MDNATEQIFLPSSSDSHTPSGLPKLENRPQPVNLDSVKEFSKVCRVCAAVSELVMPIFSGEGLQNNLADKIHKHLPIKVAESDSPSLPVVVCYQCASTLLATHELVQCAAQADAALRTRSAALAAAAARRLKQEAQERDANDESDPFDLLVFTAIVKKVLANYFHTLNVDESEDFEFVCQPCQCAAASGDALAEHLRRHRLRGAAAVARFVRRHVTFEQPLEPEPEPPPPPPSAPPAAPPASCCPFCESAFSSAARLACHLTEHVTIAEDSPVECCGQAFRQPAAFVRHAHAAHRRAPPPAACRACGHAAASAAALAAHVRRAHAGEPSPRPRPAARRPSNQKYIPTPCPTCGKTFSNKYNMAAHAKSHERDAPARFPCALCPRAYGSRGARAAHARLAHAGQLRFACPACGERFGTRTARDVHAALHSGARPHACPRAGCGAAFRARNSLLRHLDAHRGLRAHACPRCPRAFRRASHLAAHRATHRPRNAAPLLQMEAPPGEPRL